MREREREERAHQTLIAALQQQNSNRELIIWRFTKKKLKFPADSAPFVHVCETQPQEGETIVSQVMMPGRLQGALTTKLVTNHGYVDAVDKQLASVSLDPHKYGSFTGLLYVSVSRSSTRRR